MMSLPPAAALVRSMHAGTHFTDLARMEKLSELKEVAKGRSHRYSTIDETRD